MPPMKGPCVMGVTNVCVVGSVGPVRCFSGSTPEWCRLPLYKGHLYLPERSGLPWASRWHGLCWEGSVFDDGDDDDNT